MDKLRTWKETIKELILEDLDAHREDLRKTEVTQEEFEQINEAIEFVEKIGEYVEREE